MTTPTTHWVEHAMALAYHMAEARLELERQHCAARAAEWAHRTKALREHLKTPNHELPHQHGENSSSFC